MLRRNPMDVRHIWRALERRQPPSEFYFLIKSSQEMTIWIQRPFRRNLVGGGSGANAADIIRWPRNKLSMPQKLIESLHSLDQVLIELFTRLSSGPFRYLQWLDAGEGYQVRRFWMCS